MRLETERLRERERPASWAGPGPSWPMSSPSPTSSRAKRWSAARRGQLLLFAVPPHPGATSVVVIYSGQP